LNVANTVPQRLCNKSVSWKCFFINVMTLVSRLKGAIFLFHFLRSTWSAAGTAQDRLLTQVWVA